MKNGSIELVRKARLALAETVLNEISRGLVNKVVGSKMGLARALRKSADTFDKKSKAGSRAGDNATKLSKAAVAQDQRDEADALSQRVRGFVRRRSVKKKLKNLASEDPEITGATDGPYERPIYRGDQFGDHTGKYWNRDRKAPKI